MDQIIWIIVALLGGGVVIGYFVQRADSRKISRILEKQAVERNGTIKAGSLTSFPRLLIPYRQTTVEVSVVAGSSPVTSAGFSLDLLPDLSFKIRRRSARLSAQKAMGMIRVITSGDPEFDGRFVVETNDEGRTARLLGEEVRAALLALDGAYGQEKIQARLERNRFQLSVETFGREEDIFTSLIETAILFYDGLETM